MPPPHIIHMLSHAESGLQRKLKRSEAGAGRLTRAEPRLMRADGGATSSPLQKFRDQNPQYKDIPDDQLAAAIYKKYYADHMTPQQFYAQIGMKAPTDTGQGLIEQRSRIDAPHLATTQPDLLPDLGQSVEAGGIRAVAGVPGALGNAVEGVNAANKALGLRPPQDAGGQEFTREMTGTQPLATVKPWSSQDTINAAPKGVQDAANYVPQTPLGRIAEAGTEMAGPGAVLSGANKLGKMAAAGVKYGVIPGAAGEIAAEATPDPAWKPAARFAGSMVGVAPSAVLSDAARAPGAAARAAGRGFESTAARAAGAADPAIAAKANQIQMAIARNVGAGQSGSSSQQFKAAFADLDRKLVLADAQGVGLSRLYTPDERQIIRALAAGEDAGWTLDQLKKLRGWPTIRLALGLGGFGVGTAVHAANAAFPDLLPYAPMIAGVAGGSIAASTIGGMARNAERIDQARNISDLAESVTGVTPPRPGRLTPALLPNYATVPPPPQDDQNGYQP